MKEQPLTNNFIWLSSFHPCLSDIAELIIFHYMSFKSTSLMDAFLPEIISWIVKWHQALHLRVQCVSVQAENAVVLLKIFLMDPYLEEAAGFLNTRRGICHECEANAVGTGKWIIISFPTLQHFLTTCWFIYMWTLGKGHGKEKAGYTVVHIHTRNVNPCACFSGTSQCKLTALMFKTVRFVLELNPSEIPIRYNLEFALKPRLMAERVRALQTQRVLPASHLGMAFDHFKP